MKFKLMSLVVCLSLKSFTLYGEEKPKPQTETGIARSLAEFGPIKTPAEAKAAFNKAVEELGKTGGILAIPFELSQLVKSENTTQSVERKPPLPEQTKSWPTTSGITIVESNPKYLTVRVPQVEGLHFARTLRMNEGESLPHWSTNPMVTLENKLVYGSVSYLDWLQEPVTAGKDRRFYLATVRGIHAGEFLNIHGGPGYGGGVTRAYVKEVGYDKEKKLSYLVADTAIDHVAGAILHNKTNTGILHMTQESHNDNQTYDVKVIRNQYAHGDTYIYYCDLIT